MSMWRPSRCHTPTLRAVDAAALSAPPSAAVRPPFVSALRRAFCLGTLAPEIYAGFAPFLLDHSEKGVCDRVSSVEELIAPPSVPPSSSSRCQGRPRA